MWGFEMSYHQNSSLENFDIYNNSLHGSLAEQLCYNGRLYNIVVFNNNFSGELLTSVTDYLLLDNIMLNNNNFSREFPMNIWSSPLLHTMLISYNNFIVTMSTEITLIYPKLRWKAASSRAPSQRLWLGCWCRMCRIISCRDSYQQHNEAPHTFCVVIISEQNTWIHINISWKLLQNIKSLDLNSHGRIQVEAMGVRGPIWYYRLSRHKIFGSTRRMKILTSATTTCPDHSRSSYATMGNSTT